MRLVLFYYIIGFTECVRLSQSVLGTHLTYLTPIHVTLLLIHVYKMTLKESFPNFEHILGDYLMH